MRLSQKMFALRNGNRCLNISFNLYAHFWFGVLTISYRMLIFAVLFTSATETAHAIMASS